MMQSLNFNVMYLQGALQNTGLSCFQNYLENMMNLTLVSTREAGRGNDLPFPKTLFPTLKFSKR